MHTKEELLREIGYLRNGCGEEGYQPNIYRVIDLVEQVIEAMPEPKKRKTK